MHPDLVLSHAGEHGPPPFTPARLFTETDLSVWLITSLTVATVLYLYGVWRLRARGDGWPVGRTLSFVPLGIGSIAAATLSGLGGYDTTLFSVHMAQHMILLMVSPIFLALGAPVTLALRTLPHRPRSWLLALLHSRVARVFTFPLVTFTVFVASSYVLYFTGLYELTLRHNTLHELLHVHFILAGCLFFWPLIGLDPVPGRIPYPGRALMMFASMPLHAILGLVIMQQTTVIAADFYAAQHLDWVNRLHDQYVGGALLWASGDLVSLLMLGALLVQWIRASQREAARIDRQLDRLEAQEAAEAAARERTGSAPVGRPFEGEVRP